MFCIDSAAASVSTWLNRNYEMMFCRMWGFDFLAEAAGYPGVIGKRITAGFNETDMIELYEIYHGIRINVQQAEQVDAFANHVIRELKQGMPVAALINNHCLPWLNRDLNLEPFGFVLFIGYENETFLCLDIHNNFEEIQSLPFHDIFTGESVLPDNQSLLYSFSIVGDEQKIITYDDFLFHFKKSALNRKDAFLAMRSFAECIKTNLDLNRERCDIERIYFIPLLFNIMHVSRVRKLLSSTLSFLWRKTQSDFLYDLAVEFLWIGGEWNLVWNMLNKSFIIPEQSEAKLQKLKLRIANKIDEIAENEESLLDKIFNNRFDKVNGRYSGYIEKEVSSAHNGFNQIANDNIVFADLSGYLNNKAFAANESNIEGADLTGQGEYFLRQGLPDNNVLDSNGMRFLLSSNTQYDNISCRDQIIDIPRGNYRRIMFLGCSEWGEAFGWTKIFFTNGQVEKILIYLPDWFNNGAIDVPRAWKGQIVGLNHCKDERSLFAVSYLLNNDTEIEKIQLPKIENVHIFAISLEKQS
jgi:hypothetical protein